MSKFLAVILLIIVVGGDIWNQLDWHLWNY